MKKVIVFGSSGGSGSEIVKQALEHGHYVTACVRNPLAFMLKHPKLTVVKSDVTNPDSFKDVIASQDIVISAIGNAGLKATTVWSAGVNNIIKVMDANGATRLISISAGGLDVNPLNNWFIRFLTRYILQWILKEPYEDMRRMEKEIKSSDLIYTIIRPPRLINKPVTGVYRVAINRNLENSSSLSRADLAHFIVNNLIDPVTFNATVQLSY